MLSFKKVAALFSASVVCVSAWAGSGPGYINCASDSKRTKVEIVAMDLSQLNSVKLTIDDSSLSYVLRGEQEEELPGVAVSWIYKPSDKVIVVSAVDQKTGNDFQFWALPATQSGKWGNGTNFKAKINGTDPRPFDENNKNQKRLGENEIVVNCKVKYEI